MSNVDSNQFLGQEVLSIGGGDAFSTSLITADPVEVSDKSTKKEQVEHKTTPEKVENSDEKVEKPESKDKKEAVDTKEDKKVEERRGSSAFLLAESYKKEGILPDDLKIEEEITAKDLKKLLLDNAYNEVQQISEALPRL